MCVDTMVVGVGVGDTGGMGEGARYLRLWFRWTYPPRGEGVGPCRGPRSHSGCLRRWVEKAG